MAVNNKVAAYLVAAGFSTAVAIGGGYLIAPSEGLVKETYLDPVNILTSCYGHTGKELRLGQKFTDEQCLEQLGKDLSIAEAGVKRTIKVPLNDYQAAALISAFYNIGETNLKPSTMVRKFNAGDYRGGCQELTRWVYAKGKKLRGLVIRRDKEMKMCLGEIAIETSR